MSGPVVPSGADFDDERDLGAKPQGRLSRFIERVRTGPKRPTTIPARVESGVGEAARLAEFKAANRTPPEAPRQKNDQPPSERQPDPEENPVAPAAAKPSRRARKRVVVDDIIPAQPMPDDELPHRGNWDHGRGSQKNARDAIDPTRDVRWYDD